MNFRGAALHFHLCLLVIAVAVIGACSHKVKKGQAEDDKYTVLAADTVADIHTILRKAEEMVSVNRLNDATKYITINMHRFGGKEKAMLLNAKGGIEYVKDDPEAAVADYLAAMDLDPENTSYLMNVATTYQSMEKMPNATFFAKKVLEQSNASDSDKVAAQELILRCDRSHDIPEVAPQ